jgi:hypothetical protein
MCKNTLGPFILLLEASGIELLSCSKKRILLPSSDVCSTINAKYAADVSPVIVFEKSYLSITIDILNHKQPFFFLCGTV